MGLLDGDMARTFASAFSGIFLDATLHRRALTEDGMGGGSVTWADEAVKAQRAKATEAMRSADGYTDKDQRILVLADGLDRMTSDDEITCQGERWGIASVGLDSAGARFELHGRFMGNVERISAGALVAGGTGGTAIVGAAV